MWIGTRCRLALLTLAMLIAGPGSAAAQNRFIAAGVGGAAGLLAGGYTTVGIVTARANLQEHYLHDIDDVLDWQSTPLLIGSGVGALVGYLDPDRLRRTIIWGAGGAAVGAAAGAVIGAQVAKAPVDKWAGGVIGGASGILIGSLAGVVWPASGDDDDDERARPAGLVIPITVRIRL